MLEDEDAQEEEPIPPQGSLLAVGLKEFRQAAAVHIAVANLTKNYHGLLEQVVFVNKPASQREQANTEHKDSSRGARADDKETRAFKSTLRSQGAVLVLGLIWQRSKLVETSQVIATEALQTIAREFDTPLNLEQGHLTVYGMAVDTAEGPKQVSSVNSRIRTISLAAAAYGLIERRTGSGNAVQLIGTAFLHQFMVELARLHRQTLRNELSKELSGST